MTIPAYANVCCVKFNPKSPFEFVYGCAGNIAKTQYNYFVLLHVCRLLCFRPQHLSFRPEKDRQAQDCVQGPQEGSLVRQVHQRIRTHICVSKSICEVTSRDQHCAFVFHRSTDNHLRLWSAGTNQCTRTLRGHTNEKNFVGMATYADGYVACGN